MADGRVRTGLDAPGDPDLMLKPDQSSARADLRQRLDRIADGHPSSPRYADADLPLRPGDRLQARRPDGANESGWRAPEVRGHPDLPPVDSIKLTDDRARHILDGDGPGTPGGGHRSGTGRPGKTEFPAMWPDDKIVATIRDIARNPAQADWQEFNRRWRVSGEREHVRVTAIVRPDGTIWAAWPEPGPGEVIRGRDEDE